MKVYRVTIEYANGSVEQHDIDEVMWDRYIFQTLEADDRVLHYTVDTL